jgi:allophanate hydrolase subunit 1
MFWKQKQEPTPIEACAHALYEALTKALTQNGRIRVEDLISAAAAMSVFYKSQRVDFR